MTWKLVPVEPTEEMLEAYRRARADYRKMFLAAIRAMGDQRNDG